MNNIQTSQPILRCKNINKLFHTSHSVINVLKNINLNVYAQQKIAIMGLSGSGKSTLLQILGGLDQPDSGQIEFLGQNIHQLSEAKRCSLRNRSFGFIYQSPYLLPELDVLENVCLPLLIQGIHRKKAKEKAYALLKKIGLVHRLNHLPNALSGGEKHRVATARALITQPTCIFADEPTGNLDEKTASQVFDALTEFTQSSLILVTHDQRLANAMHKIFYLEQGQLKEFINRNPKN